VSDKIKLIPPDNYTIPAEASGFDFPPATTIVASDPNSASTPAASSFPSQTRQLPFRIASKDRDSKSTPTSSPPIERTEEAAMAGSKAEEKDKPKESEKEKDDKTKEIKAAEAAAAMPPPSHIPQHAGSATTRRTGGSIIDTSVGDTGTFHDDPISARPILGPALPPPAENTHHRVEVREVAPGEDEDAPAETAKEKPKADEAATDGEKENTPIVEKSTSAVAVTAATPVATSTTTAPVEKKETETEKKEEKTEKEEKKEEKEEVKDKAPVGEDTPES
jgi:hypothetical protein